MFRNTTQCNIPQGFFFKQKTIHEKVCTVSQCKRRCVVPQEIEAGSIFTQALQASQPVTEAIAM